MKPTKSYLKPVLFTCLLLCSFSCFLFINSVQNEQLLNDKVVPNEQVEEVVFPDVFAIKHLVEKILKHLPAS